MPGFDDRQMDSLLRQTMREPVPQLALDFDRKLARQLKPRRLDKQVRTILTLYVVAAIGISAWALAPLPFWAIGAAVLATIMSAVVFWVTCWRKA